MLKVVNTCTFESREEGTAAIGWNLCMQICSQLPPKCNRRNGEEDEEPVLVVQALSQKRLKRRDLGIVGDRIVVVS